MPEKTLRPWCARLGSSEELLHLEAAGDDAWLGFSPRYPWGWVYGGRIAAQALRAAILSSPVEFTPSTFQCTFLQPAHCEQPREHRVQRLADTRRRAARGLRVIQNGQEIAHVSATLDAPPQADGVDDRSHFPLASLQAAREGRFREPVFQVGCFERRLLVGEVACTDALITLDRAPRDAGESACMIAYAADDLPTDAARALFGTESYLDGEGTAIWSLTATYAMHFAPCTVGRHLLFHTRVRGILGSRATIEGTVVDVESGQVAALCLQQVMLRQRKTTDSK